MSFILCDVKQELIRIMKINKMDITEALEPVNKLQ
jgi:hypothetical protein